MRRLTTCVLTTIAFGAAPACGGSSGGSHADTTDVADIADTTDATDATDTADTRDAADSADSDIAPDTIAPDTADTADADDAADADGADDTADSAPSDADADVPVVEPGVDSDGDGIDDATEIAEGTDRFDPRSASAWHPEIAGHPRLFVGQLEHGVIAARTASIEPRAIALWARVTDAAARDVPPHPANAPYDTSIPPQQAAIAEAAALVGFATNDAAMTTKALDAIAAPFPDPSPLNTQSAVNAGDHYDLLEAEALAGFCSAYDLAAGTQGVDPDALDAARDRLVQRIDLYRNLCMTHGGCTTLLRGEPDNHAIKALAALGTCAMAVPDRPEAAADFNEAVTGVDWLAHEAQGDLEGGWAEGWNYLEYSGETHLGFLFALHENVALAAPATHLWHVRSEGWITTKNLANGDLVDIADPADDPLWRAVYQRALFVALPCGPTPPTDDANEVGQHGGLLAALFDDPRFLWNWEKVGLLTGRQLVSTFLASDPEVAAAAPTWALDGFFTDAGFSVLRASLDETSTWFEMMHEKDRMRLLGGAHEHADQLSFILAALGTDLAIDPGYIDFAHHGEVKYGKDHNMVLVDGQGPEFFLDGIVDSPPNSDAYLQNKEVGATFTTFIASTKYGGAELRRRVVRVARDDGGPEVFVVADRLVATGNHIWTFQLNGLASEAIPGTSFALEPQDIGAVATWSRPQATLHAAVVATGNNVDAASHLEENGLAAGDHRCLTIDSRMGTTAGFLTLLVPSAPDEAPELTIRRDVDGFVAVSVTFESGDTVRAWLDTTDDALTSHDDAAQQVFPGLAVAVSPGGAQTRQWTMETPPIPDPTPFP